MTSSAREYAALDGLVPEPTPPKPKAVADGGNILCARDNDPHIHKRVPGVRFHSLSTAVSGSEPASPRNIELEEPTWYDLRLESLDGADGG
jgi:hypothetical protein